MDIMNEKDVKKLMRAKQIIKDSQYSQSEQYSDALSILRRLHNKYPNNVSVIMELGRMESYFRNYGRAQNLFEKILKFDVNNRYAIVELGNVQLSLGYYDEARYFFESALKLEPNNTYAIMGLARLELAIGNIDQSEKLINKIVDKDFVAVYITLIKIYVIKEKYSEAIRYLNVISNYINNSSLKSYEYYLKHKLGMIFDGKDVKEYFNNQFVNYNEDEAIKHIELHLNENEEKHIHSVFTPNVNIAEIVELAKSQIPYLNPRYDGIVDIFIIDLEHIIGMCNNCDTSKIRIVTTHNTNNIISIYPYFNEYNATKISAKRINLVK